jgi:hypothetical protein
VGIVVERDIVWALAAGKNLEDLNSSNLVEMDLVTAHGSATIREVADAPSPAG